MSHPCMNRPGQGFIRVSGGELVQKYIGEGAGSCGLLIMGMVCTCNLVTFDVSIYTW